MSTVQIPNLPAATSLNGTELIEIVQNGVSMRATTQQLIAAAPQLTVQQIMALISQSLPAADPHVLGAWWNNGGVICISAG